MRRLADGRDALSLLEAGQLTEQKLDALASLFARFHAAHSLGTPAPFSREEWLARCTSPVEESLSVFAGAERDLALPGSLARARDRARAFVAEHADRFERRGGERSRGRRPRRPPLQRRVRTDERIRSRRGPVSEALADRRRIGGRIPARDLRYRGAGGLAGDYSPYAREATTSICTPSSLFPRLPRGRARQVARSPPATRRSPAQRSARGRERRHPLALRPEPSSRWRSPRWSMSESSARQEQVASASRPAQWRVIASPACEATAGCAADGAGRRRLATARTRGAHERT